MSSVAPTPAPSAAAPSHPPVAGSAAASPLPTRERRRPKLIGLSVALIALGGLGGWALIQSGQGTQPVVVAAHAMTPGHTVTAGDLTTVQIAGDVPFEAVADPAALVGKVAGSAIPAKTVVSPSMLAPVPDKPADQTIVAVPVKDTQIPLVGVQAGDRVNVVAGATAGGAVAAKPAAWAGTVTAVGAPNAEGVRVVDVAVGANHAPAMAGATTTGNVVISLVTRGK